MKNDHQYGITGKRRGVVLLITMVVASLVLTIGVGILNIILKEIILSSLNKDSRVAFFAADAGAECAMYWDNIDTIATSTHFKVPGYADSFFPYDSTTTDNFNAVSPSLGPLGHSLNSSFFNGFCQYQSAQEVFVDNFAASEISSWAGGSTMAVPDGNATSTTKFLLYIKSAAGVTVTTKPCALVQMIKAKNGENIEVQISSEGFSSCSGNNPRRSSRGVKVQYSR